MAMRAAGDMIIDAFTNMSAWELGVVYLIIIIVTNLIFESRRELKNLQARVDLLEKIQDRQLGVTRQIHT